MPELIDFSNKKQETVMNEYIPTYKERERMKTVAWEKFQNSDDLFIKAKAVLQICNAHYWRARENWDDNPKADTLFKKILGYEPGSFWKLDIDVYTPHWLWANQKLFSKEVMDFIEKDFGYKAKESKYMPQGTTDYNLN